MRTIVAGALGECVHVAGVSNFLRLAELAGWKTIFLGPAVPISDLLEAAKREKADMIGVSYRLTPDTGERLLGDLAEAADELQAEGVRFVFGGTPPVCQRAAKMGFFECVFDGSQTQDEILAFLKNEEGVNQNFIEYPSTYLERRSWKAPFPLIRHHFGLPTLEATIEGVEKIAKAKVLDVISLGIDQDAQENFFHPERQDIRRRGAGGVPVRSADDYRKLFNASRCGNYPLMRTYSGCDDFLRLAELYVDTIHNAWCAVPIFWFNAMDGRGPWNLEGSIREHQKVMAWYGEKGIPVELNEPHHWGMRDAPDVVSVAAAYLSAYNARFFGVKDYIAQLMFNCPPGLSEVMDLAKMFAILEMIAPLESETFHIWKETRTGLLSYPLNIQAARAQLASSIYVQMSLKPDILHVVAHVEADHAAQPEDVIEACEMAQQIIQKTAMGQPDMSLDPRILERKEQLISEVRVTLQAIQMLNDDPEQDPFVNPRILAGAVARGILDAPQLLNNRFAPGKVKTRLINGACMVVDPTGMPIDEVRRLGIQI